MSFLRLVYHRFEIHRVDSGGVDECAFKGFFSFLIPDPRPPDPKPQTLHNGAGQNQTINIHGTHLVQAGGRRPAGGMRRQAVGRMGPMGTMGPMGP